jgi:hypothetical protein
MYHDPVTRLLEALVDVVENIELLGQLAFLILQILQCLLMPVDNILQYHSDIRIVALGKVLVVSLDRGQLDLLSNYKGVAVTLACVHTLDFHRRLLSGVGA